MKTTRDRDHGKVYDFHYFQNLMKTTRDRDHGKVHDLIYSLTNELTNDKR